MLREYNKTKEEIKNPETSLKYIEKYGKYKHENDAKQKN